MSARTSPWAGLVALCLPMLIVSMDVSVLFFAMPDIAADLEPTPSQQLWIFDVYGLVLAGLLLSMGAVADRIGHRRLLLIGAVGFSAASATAAWSVNAEMLIGARALLAVAGATLMPSTLALIRHLFDDEKQRATAVGVWSAVMAGGVAVGPIVSGVLLEHFWWGSVFLINIPVMIALVFAAPLLPAHTGDRTRPVDLTSSLLVLGAVLPVVGGVKAIATDGANATALAVIAVGLAVGLAFVERQRRLPHPLIDLALLSRRPMTASIAVNLVAMFGIVGNAILITQYLQSVLGYSPLVAALWSLAPTLVVAVMAPAAGVLSVRVGRPVTMALGLLCAAAGFVVTATAVGLSSLPMVLLAGALVAGGLVIATTVVAEHVVGVAPADRAGAASGMVETSSELGGGLGIAVLGSVAAAVYRSHVDGTVPGLTTAARESLAGAVASAARFGDRGDAILSAGRAAFVDGLHTASAVAAGVMVCTAVIAVVLGRSRSGPLEPDPAADPAPVDTDTPITA